MQLTRLHKKITHKTRRVQRKQQCKTIKQCFCG